MTKTALGGHRRALISHGNKHFGYGPEQEKSSRRNSTGSNFYRSEKDNGLLAEHITSKHKGQSFPDYKTESFLCLSSYVPLRPLTREILCHF